MARRWVYMLFPMVFSALLSSQPAGAAQAPGFQIEVDYRFDALGCFDAPEVRENLEAAIAAWTRHLDVEFPEVPAGTPILVLNPQSLEEEQVILREPIDDLLLFVGCAPDLHTIARAGPSTRWYSRLDVELPHQAKDRIQSQTFQPWAGFLSINPAGDLDLFVDSTPYSDDDLPLNRRRHYDLQTLLLHELGHVLGIGTSAAFEHQCGLAQAIGVTTKATRDGRIMLEYDGFRVFHGRNSRHANDGTPIRVSYDKGHIASRFKLGGGQDLMDQDLNTSRQRPTPLDLAILEDMGFVINPNPAPLQLLSSSEEVGGQITPFLPIQPEGSDPSLGPWRGAEDNWVSQR